MSKIYIIGRRVTLPNNHEYMAEPFIAFETEAGADGAMDLVEKISGERPMKAETVLYRRGETAADLAPSSKDEG